jgi:hypothetical protein
MRPGYPSTGLPEGGSQSSQDLPVSNIPEIKIGTHVPAFGRERLEASNVSSIAAGELRAAYEAWCATRDLESTRCARCASDLALEHDMGDEVQTSDLAAA